MSLNHHQILVDAESAWNAGYFVPKSKTYWAKGVIDRANETISDLSSSDYQKGWDDMDTALQSS